MKKKKKSGQNQSRPPLPLGRKKAPEIVLDGALGFCFCCAGLLPFFGVVCGRWAGKLGVSGWGGGRFELWRRPRCRGAGDVGLYYIILYYTVSIY